MSNPDSKPEHSPQPWDTTAVPGAPSSQTRPIPRFPGADPIAPEGPAFGAAGAPRRPLPLCCWVAVISSLTSVVLAVLLWVRTPAAAPAPAPAAAPATAASSAAPATPVALQPALQPYVDAAAKGDTAAMRMLGAMYYHGLDLPRNRAEGLKWYRKAAESGSKIAQDELRQLE